MQLLTRSHKKLTRKNHRKSHLKHTKKSSKRYQLNKILQKGGAAAAARHPNNVESRNEIPEIDESTFDGKWDLSILSEFPKEEQSEPEEQRKHIEEYFHTYKKNDHLMRCFNLMLQREHLHSNGEWKVFYHSYADSHILFDIQTAIYELMYDLKPDANRVILRLFNEDFKNININNVKRQLNNNSTSNRNIGIRKLLLSVVCSLFITIYSEKFTDIFIKGYTCYDLDYNKLLYDFFKRCAVDEDKISELIEKIFKNNYIDDTTKNFYLNPKIKYRCEKSSNGQLLQIFINKSILDKISYVSMALGKPSKQTDCVNISKQARILLYPTYFQNPNLVKVYRYAANDSTHNKRLEFIAFLKGLLKQYLHF